MQENSRIGLVLLRSAWSGCGVPEDVIDQVEAHGQTISEQLAARYDLRGTWEVSSLDSAAGIIQSLNDTDLDLIVLAFQTWVQNEAMQALLTMPCSCPIVVWSVLPWRRMARPASFSGVLHSTGAVSAFAALGTLRDQKLPFLFTWGAVDDPRLLHDLDVAARAALVRGSLRRARFGLLPPGQPPVSTTLVDESRLLADLGPYVEHISLDSYHQALQGISGWEIQRYLADLRMLCLTDEMPDEMLAEAARIALALKSLAAARRLDLLALNYQAPDLQSESGIRPGLYPNLTAPAERSPDAVLYQPEADLGAATANYVLSRLAGAQSMFIEFWFWDEALNQMVGGHGGPQDPALGAPGQVWISRDYHTCIDEDKLGAQIQMVARSGRVTIFQLRATPGGWQAIAASGVVLESRPVIEGFPHALLRLDATVDNFMNRLAAAGATQHWVMAYGSVLHELEAFCDMVNIPLEVLKT